MTRHTLPVLLPLALAAWVGLPLPVARANSWWWSWPSNTAQCEAITLLIGGGTSPWNVIIAPIWGEPLWWDLTWNSTLQASFSQSNPLQFNIPLQLTAGTEYVVLGWDNSGTGYNQYLGADFPPIQIVGASSNTTCLSPAKNVIQEFTFDLVGTTEQCGNDVQITWSDTNTSHVGPRSFSIVPLDSSYAPYQVGVSGASGTYTWSPDMTAGTKFTIMMGNGDAPGDGGVAGVYNVASGTDSSCLTRTANSLTTQIPAAVVTSAMATPSTTASTARSSSTSSTSTSTSASASASASATSPARSVSAAVIGGAVGGAVGGILVISAVFIFYLSRRNSRRNDNDVDLVGEEPKIQPFRGTSDTQVEDQARRPTRYTGYDELAVAPSSPDPHDHHAAVYSATDPSSMSEDPRRHSFSAADAATVLGGHSTNSAASTSGHAYAPHGGISPYPMYSPLSMNETQDSSSARQHSYADSKRAILSGDTASDHHRSSLTPRVSAMVTPPMSTQTAPGGSAHPDEDAQFPGFASTSESSAPAAHETTPPHFIRHVDAEIADGTDQSGGPVELPPMYSEVPRRSSRQ